MQFCFRKKRCAVSLEKDHLTCTPPGQHTSPSASRAGSFGAPAGKALALAEALLRLTGKAPGWKTGCSTSSSPLGILMGGYPHHHPDTPHGKRGKPALVICHAVRDVAQEHRTVPEAAEQPGLVFRLEHTAQSCRVLTTFLCFPVAPVTEWIRNQA